MSQNSSAVTDPTQREVVITRVFNAPRELVFEAFTQCEHAKNWWGPKGFHISFCELDVKPGGKMKLCMSHPEMGDFWVSGVHNVVEPPSKLVYTSSADDKEDGKKLFEVEETFIFEDVNGQTKLTLKAKPIAIHDPIAAQYLAGMEEGWMQSLDKFERYLGGLRLTTKPPVEVTTPGREIRATRVLDAPRELVFKAWSDPAGISNWWGPNGYRTTTHQMEFKPGGTWRFTMHDPDGTDYENKVVYIQIEEPSKLVYAHSGAGENNDHILFHVEVGFRDLDGKTELDFRMVFESVEVRDELSKFGAIEGLQHTISRLENHLEQTR